MYENAVEIKELQAKVAKQVEELNTIIRQKWEIEGQLERCAKSVKALVSERDMLRTVVDAARVVAETTTPFPVYGMGHLRDAIAEGVMLPYNGRKPEPPYGCRECEEKDSTISDLTEERDALQAKMEDQDQCYRKWGVLPCQGCMAKNERIAELEAATLRLVEAAAVLLTDMEYFESLRPDDDKILSIRKWPLTPTMLQVMGLRDALSDPIILALRRE
jgi:DNA repair exonuclease SbcCD ATPase subunit